MTFEAHAARIAAHSDLDRSLLILGVSLAAVAALLFALTRFESRLRQDGHVQDDPRP